MDLTHLSALALAEAIRTKHISPVEAVEAYLERIEAVNPKINAVVTLTADEARAAARDAEARVMKAGAGEPLPPLLGVPCTVKDCFDTAGVRTTWGSRLYADRVPKQDATVVARVRAAGGIILGKSNVPEFMMGQFTDNALFGPTRNPYNLERSAGGSSGGEAAALSARLSALGVGSDLGGSLRIPAHCCGVASLRPTQGRCPLTGNASLGPAHFGTICVAGPMARSVKDLALLLSVLEGPDAADSFCQPLSQTDPRMQPVARLRVGILDLSSRVPLAAEVRTAVVRAAESLAEGGGRVEPAEDPLFDEILSTWVTLTTFGYPEMFPDVAEKRALLDPRFLRVLDVPSPEPKAYLEADRRRALITSAFFRLYEKLDVIVSAVLPTTAPMGDAGPVIDGRQRSLMRAAVHTYAAALSGDPVAVVPVANGADGLPIAVQVAAKRGHDALALSAALTLEERANVVPPKI